MIKTIGFACSLRLQWNKEVLTLLSEALDRETFKSRLNSYLSFEIEGETRLRKSRELLMAMWYNSNPSLEVSRAWAIDLAQEYPEELPAISLMMIYQTYPVVADICRFMGRLFEGNDEITNTILKAKLFDEWGERGALESTCRRVTLTMKDYGLLNAVSRTRYSLNKKDIDNSEVVKYLLATAMQLDGKGYYSFSELGELELLFPFNYSISKEDLMNDNKFVFSNFGGELAVSLA